MKRSLFAAALIGIAAIAAPRPASGQHTPSAGATSSGTATPSGGGSSSGGSSSGGTPSASGSSGGSGGGFSIDFGNNGNSSGRRRGNSPVTGTAVPRTGQPGGGGPISIGAGGFYPWGYAYGGGLGLGIYDGFYGGYYGAYDPWYGFSPVYVPSSYARNESGSIRLKVKPSNASVYVDGYYVGVVDDFDGTFQRLHLEPGPHRLEIRSADYEPLSLDVWITEDLTITYQKDLTTR